MIIQHGFKAIFLIGVLVSTACTTDTPDAQKVSSSKSLMEATDRDPNSFDKDKSRIVVYRNDVPIGLFALAAKPTLKLDDQKVGVCDRGQKLVIERAPGQYELSMQTDVIAKVTLNLEIGRTTFVSCGMLPIGILLPSPFLKVVDSSKIPERIASLPDQ